MNISLIIPRPTTFTCEQFDIFIEPLVEELKMLWDVGVNVRDINQFNGMGQFNMKAILMWTMHDLPAYGIIVGLVTKGYWGCPCYGENTMSRRSHVLHKNMYCSQHRRWLLMDHLFWHNVVAFDV
jgi:hypothetical protein